jgi:hypothetical protein
MSTIQASCSSSHMTKLIFLCLFAVTGMLIHAEPPEISVITKARDNDTLISISSSDRRSVLTFSYLGGIKDIKTNSDHSIYALNLSPGADMNEVYLIYYSFDNRINLMKNFNNRVQQIYAPRDDALSADYIRIDKIVGRILYVRSGYRDEPIYRFNVELTNKG